MIKHAKTFRVVSAALLTLLTCIVCTAQENKKLEYAILIDSTGSMRSQFDVVLKLGKATAHQVHDHGPVSIFSFQSEGIGRGSRAVTTPRIEHTQNENLLVRTIDNIYIEGGQTTLLDAIEFIAGRLNQSPAAERVIILITDGEDRVSEKNRKEVIAKLQANKTSVYAIGLVQQLEGSKRSKATELLKLLTSETGGRVIFPKSDRLEIQNLLNELALPIK
ncbi:MAG: VWA domain-containing protein [Pyrinomonadaceae bacterium]